LAVGRRGEGRGGRKAPPPPPLTPFLLACLTEETGGRSLEANLALLESNAALAGAVSIAFASVAGGSTAARSG
jgi:hypothetical protein